MIAGLAIAGIVGAALAGVAAVIIARATSAPKPEKAASIPPELAALSAVMARSTDVSAVRPPTKLRPEPVRSRRIRRAGPFRMHIEEFATKEERDQFYADLKAMGTPNVSKMTDQRGQKIVWQVLRP